MNNLNLKQILNKLLAALIALQRYAVLIFLIAMMGIYGFLIFRINNLTDTQPTDEAVAEKLQTVKRPKIDQSAVEKIQQLQGQNVEVRSLFDNARNNPFNE